MATERNVEPNGWLEFSSENNINGRRLDHRQRARAKVEKGKGTKREGEIDDDESPPGHSPGTALSLPSQVSSKFSSSSRW